MATEIERKFLCRDGSWRSAVAYSGRMEQGYLGGDACSVRVRIESGERPGAWLNVKSRVPGAVRSEFELALPEADAREMLDQFCPRRIEKIRHRVEHGGRTWEIDEFLGDNAGLVVAEIELEREDERFELPPWAGAEVTHEARYYNAGLVQQPFSHWPDREDLRFKE